MARSFSSGISASAVSQVPSVSSGLPTPSSTLNAGILSYATPLDEVRETLLKKTGSLDVAVRNPRLVVVCRTPGRALASDLPHMVMD